MTLRPSIYVAFTMSGVAGLVYEVVWSRYLGLYVGHGAYAQVLVLGVYLGGMAVGSLAVADLSKRVARPLVWYAGAEVALACFGFAFHPLFQLAATLSYDVVFPAIGSASWVGAVRWAFAGILILPQAIVLGATFPLMAAAIVRADARHPGRGVALVYRLNTLGGAAGVLLAGFVLIAWVGLPGTVVAAGVLNLGAASLVLRAMRARSGPQVSGEAVTERGLGADTPIAGSEAPPAAGAAITADPGLDWSSRPNVLQAVLLTVSFGTAVASFAYEIGWIRMLSLVLGGATHAFELMLSAFILGLAVGAWLIQDATDRARDPLRLLGGIQVLMGLTALASIPLYGATFDIVSALVRELPSRSGGYAAFNLSRYGLSLMVMLPSTVLAGMTLPLITATLLRTDLGEPAIGRVYGVNTIGSVAGAGLAGLIALPALGLKGLIVSAAALDVLLGLWLLQSSIRWAGGRGRLFATASAISVASFAAVGLGVHLDEVVVTSGVFRQGDLPAEGERRILYYQDGRTATVSAHLGTHDGVIVLATNGKPDASLGPLWRMEQRDTLTPRAIPAGRDFTTQVLAPMVALAHKPDARAVANIGHGSGMTATAFLTGERLERLVTIEIEPLMVEGSFVFVPANAPAFADPRSTFVFDDAKSFFSYRDERFDIIFAEPSNPWVSGTASLFTREFYERATRFLTRGGVLAQWMQIYELNDDLFLTVLAALDAVFPSYRAYLVGDSDVAIVARADGPLPGPDWSVLETPAFRDLTAGAPPFEAEHMQALLLFDETTFRPLLDQGGVRVNSDYFPHLDLGADRARFEQTAAEGVYSFGASPIDLDRLLRNESQAGLPYLPVPAHGLGPAVLWGRGAWLREAVQAGGGQAPEDFPDWQESLIHLQTFLGLSTGERQLGSWETWASGFDRAASELHWGTTGWADTTFYRPVYAFLDRAEAPPEARAAVDLRWALANSDWNAVAAAADRLVPRVAVGERWTIAPVLLDAAVPAYLLTGRPAAARNALTRLVPRTGRRPEDLRDRLLDALVTRAEAEAARAAGG